MRLCLTELFEERLSASAIFDVTLAEARCLRRGNQPCSTHNQTGAAGGRKISVKCQRKRQKKPAEAGRGKWKGEGRTTEAIEGVRRAAHQPHGPYPKNFRNRQRFRLDLALAAPGLSTMLQVSSEGRGPIPRAVRPSVPSSFDGWFSSCRQVCHPFSDLGFSPSHASHR